MTHEPLQPRGPGWSFVTRGLDGSKAWRRGRFLAISTLSDMELPGGLGIGPTWHVSISRRGRRRPTREECRRLLRAFGLVATREAEDNHHPGVARHFFVPIDPHARRLCECKVDETQVREPDGYVWSNVVGAEDAPLLCRGCALERMTGAPCTIHHEREGATVAP